MEELGLVISRERYDLVFLFFFFNDTATTEIYTLSLHDALPIYISARKKRLTIPSPLSKSPNSSNARSEEHTSELQSPCNLVCRLLLEKKKQELRLPRFLCLPGRELPV